jgi:hypothetical protein
VHDSDLPSARVAGAKDYSPRGVHDAAVMRRSHCGIGHAPTVTDSTVKDSRPPYMTPSN